MTQTITPKSNRLRNILVVLTMLVLLTVAAVPAMATGANITAFSIIGSNTGPSTGTVINAAAQTVAVTVLNGTDMTDMVASFTLDNGATATVDGAPQESGDTENDFSGSVTYHITGTDVSKDWTVTVIPAMGGSTAADFTSYSIPNQVIASQIRILDGTVIVTMPYGTDTTNLTASYTTSAGVTSVTVNGVAQTSGTTKNDFSAYEGLDYVITPAAGAGYAKTWNVEVRVRDNPPNFTAFSLPSIPGAGTAVITNTSLTTGTVTITVPYGTSVTSLVPTFSQTDGTAWIGSEEQTSGSTPVDFSKGSVTYDLVAGDTYTTKEWTVTVIVLPNTAAEITSFVIPGNVSHIIDSQAGTITVVVPYQTSLNGLVATFETSYGALVQVGSSPQNSGVTPNNFAGGPLKYNVTAADQVHVKNWTVSVINGADTSAEILTYSLPGQIGSAAFTYVNTSYATIQVTLPAATDRSALIASFTKTPSATVRVGTTLQTSGETPNNFGNTAGVTYIVTAPDGVTTKTWVIMVVYAPSTDAQILSYTLPGQFGSSHFTSTSITGRVNLTEPSGPSLTSLHSNFTLSTGALATNVSGYAQTNNSLNDFTHQVVYKVTAADGFTNKTWTINANLVEFATYTLPGQQGPSLINTSARTVNISIPYAAGSNLILPATFTTTSGVTAVNIGSTPQTSGPSGTTNNFNAPVIYSLTGLDGDVFTWTVNVRTAPNTFTNITAYNLPNNVTPSIISQGTVNITVAYVPVGTWLNATFALDDGATARVSGVIQVNDITPNRFTTPVRYVVTAADGSTTQNWDVNVTFAPNTAANITGFSLPVTGAGIPVINYTAGTVNITVPTGTDLTSPLTPTIALSDFATSVPASGVAQNFANPVTYLVTAQNPAFSKTWVVNVNVGYVPKKVGTYQNGGWYLDSNGDFSWGTGDNAFTFTGAGSGWMNITGDWNGDGKTEVGIYKDGIWGLDYNGNGQWDSSDKAFYFSGAGTGWTPLVGDWNGDSKTEVGIYKDGIWGLDYNGNGQWDSSDKAFYFSGAGTGWTPLVGDWNGDGKTEVGIYKDGIWGLDYNGNGQWDSSDKAFYFSGAGTGWTPLVGDWNGDSKTEVGIYKDGIWGLDYNGLTRWDATSKAFYFSGTGTGWTPLVGDWNGDGLTKVGIYKNGVFGLDYNGLTRWDTTSKAFWFPTGTPIVGKW